MVIPKSQQLLACLNVRELRALVIEIVLATDMSFHFQQVKNMKNLLLMPEKFVVFFLLIEE